MTTSDQQRSRLKSAARIAAENGMRLTVKPDGTIVMEPADDEVKAYVDGQIYEKPIGPRHPKTFVYFIECKKDEVVKIGYSQDPFNRLRHISRGAGPPLTMRYIRPGTRTCERILHKKFAEYRFDGEWFEVRGSLKEYIDRLPIRSDWSSILNVRGDY